MTIHDSPQRPVRDPDGAPRLHDRQRLRGRHRLRGLRARILASFLAVATVALVVALAACAFGLERILVSTAADAARSENQQVSRALAAGETPARAVQESSSSAQVVQILDASGRVNARTQPTLRRPITAPEAGTHRTSLALGGDRDHFVVVTQRADGGAGHTWWVATAVPIEQDDAIIKAVLVLLGATALVLLGAAAWGINRVVTRSLAPVDRIRADVDRIETSGSAVRVEVPATGDEIERLAVTMNRMLERLDAADAAQRAFVSDASHELRSPLATIRLLSETDPDTTETSRLVHREALRMQSLVDDLLTLAKADDRGLALTVTDVDLDDLADAELRRLKRVDGPSGVTVTGRLDPVRVRGDVTRLEQVVRNLADNAARHATSAVRFTTTDEPADLSRLGSSAGDDGGARHAVLVVENDGPPVPSAERDAVFGRFVRLDEARSRDRGGSGLGLAISRALAQAHGGTLTTDESPDGWCRFTLRLPVDG